MQFPSVQYAHTMRHLTTRHAYKKSIQVWDWVCLEIWLGSRTANYRSNNLFKLLTSKSSKDSKLSNTNPSTISSFFNPWRPNDITLNAYKRLIHESAELFRLSASGHFTFQTISSARYFLNCFILYCIYSTLLLFVFMCIQNEQHWLFLLTNHLYTFKSFWKW